MTSTAKPLSHGISSREMNGVHPPQADSETMDVESSSESPITVQLIVGYGTHAGVTAEILQGFYMIGRHGECQIRPKSQSVSRRHCLVQHQSGAVRVFDLDSKRGTFINDVRLAPRTWQLLNHGDRLRCGTYWFNVAVYAREVEAELDGLSEDIGEVGDADIFDNANFQTEGNEVSGDITESLEDVGEPLESAANDATTTATPTPKKSKPSRLPKPKITKFKTRQSSSGSGFSIDFTGPDSWKVLLAAVTMVVVIAYLGWSMYSLHQGPPVKILRDID